MFANALKSISATNITGNYSISSTPISTAGAWKIHDCKRKSTGKPYSVFIFDRKTLDASSSSSSSAFGSSSSRSSSSAYKRATDEVVERLRKEAAALARLRHPNILELVEPVEDTRGGGLQFVTELVLASLTNLLAEKEEAEKSGGSGGARGRYTTAEDDGPGRRRRELELDELEIQKGLSQISKALEFLHENAGLVHGNLTPDAILVNSKSDWKISGLAFCSPAANSDKPTSFQPVALSEVLNPDPRLPRSVHLNLDFTSPDFVLDNNMTSAADMFSLGILCVSLYNSPHKSPLEAHGSLSSYKRLFSSSSTVPTLANNYLSSKPIPKELASLVLPKLIARRPAQRMTAKEFQLSEYFDNVLVSTIRFLDSFPAKTPTEKSAFMRGLTRVLPSFPKSVMERKVLPALADELKDRDLLSLILHNVFRIVELLPAAVARRVFADRVRPALRDVFITNNRTPAGEKDPLRDAGLRMVLEHMPAITANCNGKEFKDDILPIYMLAIDSSTPSLVGFSLESLSSILPVLDFSTIKNELFPVIANMFSRTVSLGIKVAGLKAFVVLCGGSLDGSDGSDALDGLNGFDPKKKASTSSTALDKYTMQEKIVPLIKMIKTKEPLVMLGALHVLQIIGEVADADFVALEILPILWSMSLGPLLNVKQFTAFMDMIRTLSQRVEDEQLRKLQEMSGAPDVTTAAAGEDFMAFGGVTGTQFDPPAGDADDFERLVKGRATTSGSAAPSVSAWDDNPPSDITSPTMSSVGTRAKSPVTMGMGTGIGRTNTPPTFSWSTPPSVNSTPKLKAPGLGMSMGATTGTGGPSGLGSFKPLALQSTQFSQPLQPSVSGWNSTTPASNNTPASSAFSSLTTGMSSLPMNQPAKPSWSSGTTPASSFSLPPPPPPSQMQTVPSSNSGFSLPPLPSGGMGMGMGMSAMTPSPAAVGNPWAGTGSGSGMGMAAMAGQPRQAQQQQQQQQPQVKPPGGLDMYQSLL